MKRRPTHTGQPVVPDNKHPAVKVDVRSLEKYQEDIAITNHKEDTDRNCWDGLGIMSDPESDRSAKTTDITNKTEKHADDAQAL